MDTKHKGSLDLRQYDEWKMYIILLFWPGEDMENVYSAAVQDHGYGDFTDRRVEYLFVPKKKYLLALFVIE